LFLPVAIVFVLYIYWLLKFPIDESFLGGLIILAFYFAGTIFVRLSEKHWAFSLLIFLILLPISIYIAILEFVAHIWITTDLEIHSHLIGLAIAVTLLVVDAALIIRNHGRLNRAAVMPLLLFIVTLPFFTLNFGYFVVYYSSTGIIDQVQFENSTYLVVHAEDSDFHGYVTFYKCSTWRFSCEGLYGSYSSMGWKIVIDEQNKEVSVFEEGTSSLVYTDGKNPRAYAGTGGTLYDHSYYLSEQCNNLNNDEGYYKCESYTYIPYKCNAKSILCESIPIQYTEEYYGYYYWVEDVSKNEISLYDENDVLIFTYGKDSRCYVDGCKILP
jgi:hypothetical protein